MKFKRLVAGDWFISDGPTVPKLSGVKKNIRFVARHVQIVKNGVKNVDTG